MAWDPAQRTTAESLPAPRDRVVRVGPGSDRRRGGAADFLRSGFSLRRTCRGGEFLVNELAAAQACLLDPRQRAEYDQTLRQAKSAARSGAAAKAAAAPTTAPPAPSRLVEPAALGEAKPADRRRAPPPAADFLSRMSTPTHHEARPLKHKKERTSARSPSPPASSASAQSRSFSSRSITSTSRGAAATISSSGPQGRRSK